MPIELKVACGFAAASLASWVWVIGYLGLQYGTQTEKMFFFLVGPGYPFAMGLGTFMTTLDRFGIISHASMHDDRLANTLLAISGIAGWFATGYCIGLLLAKLRR